MSAAVWQSDAALETPERRAAVYAWLHAQGIHPPLVVSVALLPDGDGTVRVRSFSNFRVDGRFMQQTADYPLRDLTRPAPDWPGDVSGYAVVACPRCKAEPGQPCRTLSTQRVTDTHAARIDRWWEAREERRRQQRLGRAGG